MLSSGVYEDYHSELSAMKRGMIQCAAFSSDYKLFLIGGVKCELEAIFSIRLEFFTDYLITLLQRQDYI